MKMWKKGKEQQNETQRTRNCCSRNRNWSVSFPMFGGNFDTTKISQIIIQIQENYNKTDKRQVSRIKKKIKFPRGFELHWPLVGKN